MDYQIFKNLPLTTIDFENFENQRNFSYKIREFFSIFWDINV